MMLATCPSTPGPCHAPARLEPRATGRDTPDSAPHAPEWSNHMVRPAGVLSRHHASRPQIGHAIGEADLPEDLVGVLAEHRCTARQ